MADITLEAKQPFEIVPLEKLVLSWKTPKSKTQATVKNRDVAASPKPTVQDLDPLYRELAVYAKSLPVLNTQTIVDVVLKGMELIETVIDLQGKSKKEWVLAAIDLLLKTFTGMSESSRAELLNLLRTTIPLLIDRLVAAANLVYNFGKKVAEEADNCKDKCASWCCVGGK